LLVFGIARQRATHFDRLAAAREDRDAVPRFLADVDNAIAGVANCLQWESAIVALELLQADDVGRFALEPIEQALQPAADSIDVVGGDLERSHADSSGARGDDV
jgi:hypothetical protein